MKTSVAMATFNGQEFILEQLESILKQTRALDEVIIIDDCSTDNTVDVIKRFIAANHLYNWEIKVNTNNVGYIENFKNALKLTTGDLVFLSDQDDVWFPEKIEHMASVMESHKNIQLLCCRYQMVDENLVPIPHKIHRVFKSIIGLCNRSRSFPPAIARGCAFAVSRKLCDEYVKMPLACIPHDCALAEMAALSNGMFYYKPLLMLARFHKKNNSLNMLVGSKSIIKIIESIELYLSMSCDEKIIIDTVLKKDKRKKKIAFRKLHYTQRLNVSRLNFLREKRIFLLFKYFWYVLRKPWKLKTFVNDIILVYLI